MTACIVKSISWNQPHLPFGKHLPRTKLCDENIVMNGAYRIVLEPVHLLTMWSPFDVTTIHCKVRKECSRVHLPFACLNALCGSLSFLSASRFLSHLTFSLNAIVSKSVGEAFPSGPSVIISDED